MTSRLTRRHVLQAGTALLSLPALSGCAIGTTPAHQAPPADQALIETKMAEHRVPGVGVAFIEDGKVTWEQGFGYANIDTDTPITTTTLFQAASLTKPAFAYVVMQAVDRGEISLNDPLVSILRPADLAPIPWSDQITVRDALQHTAGLPNWRADEDGPDPLTPAYEPGTDTSYSGEAYHWLQKVMETHTGQGLNVLMTDRLLRPAGLEDMRLLWEPERASREVYGHVFDENDGLIVADLQFTREMGYRLNEVAQRWGKPMGQWTAADQEQAAMEIRPHTHPRLVGREPWVFARPGALRIDSASSLRCTPGDYARFMCLMMPGRARAPWEITEVTRRMMLAPQFERPDVQGGVLPRGLGWGLEKRGTGTAFYHWGKNGRSHNSVALGDPGTGKGIVVMTNGSNGKPLIVETVTALMGENYIGITT